MTPGRLRFIALACLGLIVLAAAAFLLIDSTRGSSVEDRAGQAALSYADGRTVWVKGPAVKAVYLTRLPKLKALLAQKEPKQLVNDVNVADLQRRVGKNRQVALVLLTGVFNTLPPDEGVVIHADMAAIVDLRGNRVLLLTD